MLRLDDVPAPAKLNLFLHVLGRREDGYHLLQSVFMLVDWADTLHFERRSDDRITREDLGGRAAALPADDLCVRAARALQSATGCTQGAHIRLDKQIPSQAGMGGGSSDAASCLLALNRLWDLRLDRMALQRIGLTLGADVPFFLGGRNAWVEGVGERLTPVELPAGRFVVVKPRAGVPTPDIFRSAALKRDTEPATIMGFAADPWRFGRNDLQPVAEGLCAEVTEALRLLAGWGVHGRMTGSGSAVFAALDDSDSARHNPDWALGPDRLADLPDGWTARVCSNLPAHPLHGWTDSLS